MTHRAEAIWDHESEEARVGSECTVSSRGASEGRHGLPCPHPSGEHVAAPHPVIL